MSNDNLQPFPPGSPDNPPGYGLRDYTHASKTFGVSGGSYNLAPRNKFLFHVYFNLNTNIPAVANLVSGGKSSVIGLMVKTAQLPSYQVDVSTMNQYNRKRLVQTKINYNPAQIVFNDDHSDLIRNMWYQYYQYYYSDPTYKYGNTPNQSGVLGEIQVPAVLGGAAYVNDTYTPSRGVQHWGLSGQGYNNPTLQSLATSLLTGPASGQLPFFNDITIYGLAQKSYAQYTMINPLITDWQHDTYDYSQGNGVVTHTMTIKYEAVKYYSGDIGGNQPSEQVTGFADPAHYDTNISAIARPGSNNQPGGASGNKQDLQALAQGQNTLQNVIGAVGQGLVPTAAAFAGAALAGSGTFAQGILSQFAPTMAGGSIESARQAAGAVGSFFTPTPAEVSSPNNQGPVTASYNADGTVNANDANAYGAG
jgi:hypothetical protein